MHRIVHTKPTDCHDGITISNIISIMNSRLLLNIDFDIIVDHRKKIDLLNFVYSANIQGSSVVW